MYQSAGTLVSAAILAATLGCATIISGTDQEVKFHSQPDNATVTIDKVTVGRTPLVHKLSRKDKHTVRFELEGYAPADMTFSRGVNGWVFGNIIFGGLIGVAIDAIDGAMYSLSPDDLNGALARADATSSITKSGLYVIVVLHPEPGWQRIGTLEAVK
jgi:hypothetical protein